MARHHTRQPRNTSPPPKQAHKPDDSRKTRLVKMRIAVAPGALFHAGRAPSTLMRINFATTQNAVFWATFERLKAGMPGGVRLAG